jgi:xanthine dehydrogenase YagS FAD-binding subunit
VNPFEFAEPESLEEAVALLTEEPGRAEVIAGGTDLLSELKDGLRKPRRLVSLAGIEELSGVLWQTDGVRLGASVTLVSLVDDERLSSEYPILGQAARSIATPQIRSVGTLGGNLCQRPRCWYYRHPDFPCYKKGGVHCYGANGYNRNLAILGGGASVMVHPSDMAPPLIAMDAGLEAFGPQGRRTMALRDFFAGPNEQQMQEHVLHRGEIVTALMLPKPMVGTRSIFLKAQDRTGEDFALASVAASVSVSDGVVTRANVILGGVAPTPYRAQEAEEYLLDQAVKVVDPSEVAELAVCHARPLRHNGFKVILAKNLVRHTIETILNQES